MAKISTLPNVTMEKVNDSATKPSSPGRNLPDHTADPEVAKPPTAMRAVATFISESGTSHKFLGRFDLLGRIEVDKVTAAVDKGVLQILAPNAVTQDNRPRRLRLSA
jgi:hypothetical protein